MPKYKIIVDKDICIGCGSCNAICPGNFGFDKEENKALVRRGVVGKLTCEREAADACPVSAISIQEKK